MNKDYRNYSQPNKNFREEVKEEVKEVEKPVKVYPTYKVVSTLPLNVRSLPSTDSSIKRKLYPGTEIKVEFVNDNWAHIVDDGYVMANYISEVK